MAVTEQQQNTATLTMSQAINRAISDALETDETIVLLGQDIGAYGGTFGVYRGLYDRFGGEIVRDGPLCESATVGVGVGLAIAGVRTIVEVEFMDFLGVAMDQIVNQAAKVHSTTNGKLNVPMVLRTPVVSRMGMGSQHSQSLESWFMHVPGLKVVMPSNADDAYGLMRTALQDQNPVLFIENGRLYGRRGEVALDADPIPFGQVRVAREGTDATVVALGGMVDDALVAAKTLEAEGISVEVIDPRTVSPLDVDGIIASLAKTMRLAVTHEAHKTAGFGAEVAALCVEHGFEYLDAPIERVAALDVPVPCGPEWSEVYPSADSIAAAVRRMCGEGA